MLRRYSSRAFITISITVLLVEASSRVLVHYKLLEDLFGNNSKTEITKGDWNWRNEKMPWGAWHKPDTVDKAKDTCYEITYESNSYGARDKQFNSLTPRNKRTLLIGDSFAEGFGLNKSDTLDSILENLTDQDIYNLGSAHAVGPVQYFLIYEHFAKVFDHDNLIITFLPSNDFQDNDPVNMFKSNLKFRYRPYYRKISENSFDIQYPQNAIKTDDIYKQNSRIQKTTGYSINVIKQELIKHSTFARVLKSLKYRQTAPIGYYGGTTNEQVNAALFFLEKTISLAKEQQVKSIVLFVIPTLPEIEFFQSNNFKPEWLKDLKMLEQKYNQLKVIDGLDSFSANNANPKDLFLECDGHWSPEGASLAAGEISKYLR